MGKELIASQTLGDLLKNDDNPEYSREELMLKKGVLYPLGAVLGKITATGDYILSPKASVKDCEGAELACAVLLSETDAFEANTKAVCLVRGMSIVADGALVYDPSVTSLADKKTKHEQLTACGIVVRHNG